MSVLKEVAVRILNKVEANEVLKALLESAGIRLAHAVHPVATAAQQPPTGAGAVDPMKR